MPRPRSPAPPGVRENAPLAGTTYKNVQVLGELSIGEFGRTMNAITAWVSPKQSCAHCHVEVAILPAMPSTPRWWPAA